MSDNNSKNLIEHTVKLLKLESQELNEYVVPGLPIGSGVVNRKERLRAEMERLARQQTMGRWSQSLTNPYTAHAGHMDNKFKGGYFLFDPKHNKTLKNKLKNSPDQYDEKDDYEKNETNESFSQYYGKATHHPMTKHGDPVQDSWNDQLRSRSGMMTQNNLKSYTEPYWNTTKTGPSTEKEFIDDIHKVNGILDGEDYIKSTFDNINNSVPFKSHGRDNDASPTYDAQTILPQIHKNEDSPTDNLNKFRLAYESVITPSSNKELNEWWKGGNNGDVQLSPERNALHGFDNTTKDQWADEHKVAANFHKAQAAQYAKDTAEHLGHVTALAKKTDELTKGAGPGVLGRLADIVRRKGSSGIGSTADEDTINNISNQAHSGEMPDKRSLSRLSDIHTDRAKTYARHVIYANDAIKKHDVAAQAHQDVLSHLDRYNKDWGDSNKEKWTNTLTGLKTKALAATMDAAKHHAALANFKNEYIPKIEKENVGYGIASKQPAQQQQQPQQYTPQAQYHAPQVQQPQYHAPQVQYQPSAQHTTQPQPQQHTSQALPQAVPQTHPYQQVVAQQQQQAAQYTPPPQHQQSTATYNPQMSVSRQQHIAQQQPVTSSKPDFNKPITHNTVIEQHLIGRGQAETTAHGTTDFGKVYNKHLNSSINGLIRVKNEGGIRLTPEWTSASNALGLAKRADNMLKDFKNNPQTQHTYDDIHAAFANAHRATGQHIYEFGHNNATHEGFSKANSGLWNVMSNPTHHVHIDHGNGQVSPISRTPAQKGSGFAGAGGIAKTLGGAAAIGFAALA